MFHVEHAVGLSSQMFHVEHDSSESKRSDVQRLAQNTSERIQSHSPGVSFKSF